MIGYSSPGTNVDDLKREFDKRVVSKSVVSSGFGLVWGDALNISDKGVLTGIYQGFHDNGIAINTTYYGKLRITIDGTVILTLDAENEALCNLVTNAAVSDVSERRSGSLSFNHKFETSLRVEVCTSDNGARTCTIINYTID